MLSRNIRRGLDADDAVASAGLADGRRGSSEQSEPLHLDGRFLACGTYTDIVARDSSSLQAVSSLRLRPSPTTPPSPSSSPGKSLGRGKQRQRCPARYFDMCYAGDPEGAASFLVLAPGGDRSPARLPWHVLHVSPFAPISSTQDWCFQVALLSSLGDGPTPHVNEGQIVPDAKMEVRPLGALPTSISRLESVRLDRGPSSGVALFASRGGAEDSRDVRLWSVVEDDCSEATDVVVSEIARFGRPALLPSPRQSEVPGPMSAISWKNWLCAAHAQDSANSITCYDVVASSSSSSCDKHSPAAAPVCTLVGHEQSVSAIETDEVNSLVVSSSKDSSVRLWDLRDKVSSCSSSSSCATISGPCMCLKVVQDKNVVLAFHQVWPGVKTRLSVFDVRRMENVVVSFSPHSEALYGVPSRIRSSIARVGDDRFVSCWSEWPSRMSLWSCVGSQPKVISRVVPPHLSQRTFDKVGPFAHRVLCPEFDNGLVSASAQQLDESERVGFLLQETCQQHLKNTACVEIICVSMSMSRPTAPLFTLAKFWF